ncbi:YraN family protein [soil metagenome]
MTAGAIGAAAEQRAREYLEQQGLVFVASNWRAHFHKQAGELDLVMRDGATLVFVEVRARASRAFGGAAASVTPVKQARLRLAARAYLNGLGGPEPRCRFDVVALEAGRLDWLRDAF